MSLTDEERKTLVALELKKARDTYEEIGIYNCVYDVEPEELLSRIEPAKQLIDEIEQLINS